MKKNIITISIISLLMTTPSYAGCFNSSDGRTFCEERYDIPSGNIERTVTLSCGGGKRVLGYMFSWPKFKPAGYSESGIAPIKVWGRNTGFTKTSWRLKLANGAGSSRPPYPLKITTVCK